MHFAILYLLKITRFVFGYTKFFCFLLFARDEIFIRWLLHWISFWHLNNIKRITLLLKTLTDSELCSRPESGTLHKPLKITTHSLHSSSSFVISVIFLSGVHIIQRISGCEWDENTDSVTGVLKYGYNGEGFLEFDMKTLTWIALKPEADIIKQSWDADTTRMKDREKILTKICPEWLKMYVESGNSSLQRTGRITWPDAVVFVLLCIIFWKIVIIERENGKNV